MRHRRWLLAKLRNLFGGERAKHKLARELNLHLTFREEKDRRGTSSGDAWLAAPSAHGGVGQAQELHGEERSVLWLEHVLQDVRYAIRGLLKSPGFAAVAVLTLALGIGANVAIFTVVNAVLLQPLPFPQPERLVRVFDDLNGAGARDVGLSVPELLDLRDRSGVFDHISALWPLSNALTGGDHAERIELLITGFDYFQILDANAALGRVYGPADAVPGIAEAVVISDGLWKRQFGGDPHVLGRRIRVDEDGYTIVGVMPPNFRHPGETLASDVELWVAAGFTGASFPSPPVRDRFVPGAIGRLKPGLTIQQAQQRLNALVAHLTQTYPKDYPAAIKWSLRLEPAQESLTGGVRPTLVLLLAAVAFVLLIVSVNMATLLVARWSSRMRELAIRQALGASRGRLVRQLLTESALLSLTGGLAAMVVLSLTRGSLLVLMPADLPRLNEVHFHARIVGLALLLSLGTGILFGSTPAWHASNTDPNWDLKEGGRSETPGVPQNRFRGVLVAAEIALSVVLLSTAGLLVRSFWNTLRVNPGIDANRLMVARIWFPQPNNPALNRYATAPPIAAFSREVLRRVRMLPGIEDAATGGTNSVPLVHTSLAPSALSLPDEPDSGQKQRSAEFTLVSPEFFRVVRTPVLRGRVFTEADSDKTKRVVLVNESFAKQYLSGHDVGARLHFFSGNDWEIAGVVGDIRNDGLDKPVAPRVYLSLYQSRDAEMAVFLRGSLDTAGLREAVTRIVHQVDPELPVYGVRSMQELISASLARRRFSLDLIAGFAGLALFLASIGIYGVMAYAVSQRTPEFGIRMALGAQPRDIMLLAFRPGLVLTLAGVVAGLIGALIATRWVSSLLFGVSPSDPLTYAVVSVALALAALLACWIPARRAVRIPPVIALRS